MAETFQVTISGRESGGFVWENVFHVTNSYGGTDSTFAQSGTLAALVAATIVPDYAASMASDATILAVSARAIDAVPSLTNVIPSVVPGTRGASGQVGSIAGRIVFIPTPGSTRPSSMFCPGGMPGDFVNDQIQAPYLGFLNAVGDDFLLLDGSDVTYQWQLVQWHKKTSSSTNIDEFYVSPNPSSLNKRIRP